VLLSDGHVAPRPALAELAEVRNHRSLEHRFDAEPGEELVEDLVSNEATSLDVPHGGADPGGASALGDTIASHEEGYGLWSPARRSPVSGTRSRSAKDILHLRFAQDLTQLEVAEHLGISQMHVSRLQRRELDRLRTASQACS
jgi:RNA polymerase sigma-B factor